VPKLPGSYVLSLGLPSFKVPFHTCRESLRLGVTAAGRLDQTHERIQLGAGIEILGLTIREATQASKVPPVGCAVITAELRRQGAVLTSLLSRSGCFIQAWKLPGDVSTIAAGLKPVSLIAKTASVFRSSTMLKSCSPLTRLRLRPTRCTA